MQKIRWLVVILGAIVLVTAMLQNSEPTTLKLFVFEKAVPTSILLLATSVVSFLVGGLVFHRAFRRRDQAKPVKSPKPTNPEPGKQL